MTITFRRCLVHDAEKRSGSRLNTPKPSWPLKLLISSSLVLTGTAVVPFSLSSTGLDTGRVEAASTYTTTALGRSF